MLRSKHHYHARVGKGPHRTLSQEHRRTLKVGSAITREVYIGFDSDVFRNPGVGDAARGLWRHLEGRGAPVSLSYLPDQADGSKTGADDFLAAPHTYGDYMETFWPFDASELQAERLKRDARLRIALADLGRRFWRFDRSGMGAHSARDVALLEAAWVNGKLAEDGVQVAKAWGPLEVEAKVSRRTLFKALDYLEEWGIAWASLIGFREEPPGPPSGAIITYRLPASAPDAALISILYEQVNR